MTIDTTNMCSHLQKKLFDEDCVYHYHRFGAECVDYNLHAAQRRWEPDGCL